MLVYEECINNDTSCSSSKHHRIFYRLVKVGRKHITVKNYPLEMKQSKIREVLQVMHASHFSTMRSIPFCYIIGCRDVDKGNVLEISMREDSSMQRRSISEDDPLFIEIMRNSGPHHTWTSHSQILVNVTCTLATYVVDDGLQPTFGGARIRKKEQDLAFKFEVGCVCLYFLFIPINLLFYGENWVYSQICLFCRVPPMSYVKGFASNPSSHITKARGLISLKE